MKITVFIIGILAILLNDVVVGEPTKKNVNQNNKSPGKAVSEIVFSGKNPKRDSSDQTAVEDKTGQSQNAQNYQQHAQQYQPFVPLLGQYYAQAATQQVHYAKPEGGIDYAKSEDGIQYASSTHRSIPAAYQTIAYSAHHNGAQQPNNGKSVAQIQPVQYSPAPVHYYTLPPQHHGNHQNIQYAIAVPAGNGHQQHQQISFAALPGHGYHHAQHNAQLTYAVQPQAGQYYRGEPTPGHYSLIAPHHQQVQQLPNHHQLSQQYALITSPASAAPAHHQPQLNYAKLPVQATQQAVIYATHPGHQYFAGQSANPGYYQYHAQQPLYQYHDQQPIYQHHGQPIYQHQAQALYQQAYAQPAIQYSAKPASQKASAVISVTPAPNAAVHYKNFITTTAPNSNHNGAISFSKYSAQLPVNPRNSGASNAFQVIKAPVTYATTAAPQHNGGSVAGKIFYTAIPAQYQDAGQGYTHPGTIHFGQHLYHPTSSAKQAHQ